MEMEMEFLRKLPTPAELKEEYPVSAQVVATKAERDDEIRAIFEGKEDKLILVIGPCSADNEDAVIDYISRLRKVQDKVADSLLSSDLVQQIMKMLSATMQTVLQRFRKRQKTDFSLYQEFIPISQEPQAKAIWVCSISRTRKKKRIC